MKMFSKKSVLVLLSLISIWLLTWCGSSTPDVPSWEVEAAYEEVALWHDGLNTIPEVTTLPAGKNYKFTITPEADGRWCMSTIRWKSDQGGQIVAKGQPIEMVLENAEPGEYEFVCNGMGMRQGSVIIEA